MSQILLKIAWISLCYLHSPKIFFAGISTNTLLSTKNVSSPTGLHNAAPWYVPLKNTFSSSSMYIFDSSSFKISFIRHFWARYITNFMPAFMAGSSHNFLWALIQALGIIREKIDRLFAEELHRFNTGNCSFFIDRIYF